MNEGEFNRAWHKALEDAGALVFAVVASTMQAPGWPDRHVSSVQWTGWLEGKVERSMPSVLQLARTRDLLLRGSPVWVVRLTSRDRLRQGSVVLEAPMPNGAGDVDRDTAKWTKVIAPLRFTRSWNIDGKGWLQLLAEYSPGVLAAWAEARREIQAAARATREKSYKR